MKLIRILVVLGISLLFITSLSPLVFAGTTFSTKPLEKGKTSSFESKPSIKKSKKMRKLSTDKTKKNCKKLSMKTQKDLPDANDGLEYKTQLETTGGLKPIHFAKVSSLPYGLQLSMNGLLKGRITKPGEYQFKIKVTDSCDPVQVIQKQFYLTVRPKMKIDATSVKSIVESKNKIKQPRKIKMASVAHFQNKPIITSLITSPPNLLKPNGLLRLKGLSFGDNPGKVYMKGNSMPEIMLFLYGWKSDEIKCRVDHNTDVFESQEIDIWIETSDKKLSNIKKIDFEGRVEYTCEGSAYGRHFIIRGSDGSEKDCTPYICYTDPDGFGIGITCKTNCSTTADCADGYRCSSAATCVPIN